MGRPPRVGSFSASRGLASIMKTGWGELPAVSIEDLIALKKTRRLYDYEVISSLVQRRVAQSERPSGNFWPGPSGSLSGQRIASSLGSGSAGEPPTRKLAVAWHGRFCGGRRRTWLLAPDHPRASRLPVSGLSPGPGVPDSAALIEAPGARDPRGVISFMSGVGIPKCREIGKRLSNHTGDVQIPVSAPPKTYFSAFFKGVVQR